MGKISELLKWKNSITLKDKKGNVLTTAYIRVLDDNDLADAYRDSRIVSAELRAKLRDPESKEHKDSIAIINEATREECEQLIKVGKSSNVTSEAFANVERAELPKLEEIAIDADAPTLEEQERLDAAILKIDKEYADAVDKYIDTRMSEVDSEMAQLNLDEMRTMAKEMTIDVVALSAFINRLTDERVWRGTYEDDKYRVRAFVDYDEFDRTDSFIKEQLRRGFESLTSDPEKLKN